MKDGIYVLKQELILLYVSLFAMLILVVVMAYKSGQSYKEARHWQDVAMTNMVVKGHP